ncbi:hypothetical protein HYU45_02540 [Candidatus Daviesbacteria bacterium]|nr:hypothetical protein [Candidatus Daviesbacteria bacterium]
MKKDRKTKFSVVATSIYEGNFLETYVQKMTEEKVEDQTRLIIIPDRKTPKELYQKCKDIKRRGFNILCPTLDDQDEYLRKLGPIFNTVPYNSDSRRNVGYLMAYELGDEVIISIDDDNFPIKGKDFFKEHEVVGRGKHKSVTIQDSNGWFNICSLLNFSNPGVVYARGFPYFARFKQEKYTQKNSDVEIHMNAGLWLKAPDVDAITWLGVKPNAISFKKKSLVLANKTWTPINTQNTSLNRAVIPSYWFVKMGYPISGLSIDRYGDIFSGFFAQACVKHLGFNIRVGSPIINHIRNTHNAIKDLNYEFMCVIVLEDILNWLTEVKLEGSSYAESYLSLASQMEDAVQKFDSFIWNAATRGYFHHLAYSMRIWVKTVKTLSGV